MKITNFRDDKILSYEKTEDREVLERGVDRLHLAVGGFDDLRGTHYSRAKLKFDFAAGQPIILRTVFDFPLDFYQRHEASLKLMTVGTESPYQRLGLWLADDGFPRLQVEYKGRPLKTMWTGTKRIPTGRTLVRLLLVPSAWPSGLMRVSVNGERWGETRGANIDAATLKVNRAVFGMDGAAGQDTKQLSLDILEIEVRSVEIDVVYKVKPK